MKQLRQRPVKTAGYDFSKQAARRAKRRTEAQIRQASPSDVARGLHELLKSAVSESEIKDFLANGILHFPFAAAKTRRQWSATAKRRIQQLTNKQTNKQTNE